MNIRGHATTGALTSGFFGVCIALLFPAAAFAINYLPGQTLDPSCLPSDPTCIVVNPSATNIAAVFEATSSTATSTFAGDTYVSGTASSTNLVASNTFTIGTLTGILRAVAGAVTTGLVNLASDVTGILPAINGGTGVANPSYGQVLVGNALGGYTLMSTSSLGISGGGGNSFSYPFPSNATSTTLDFSSGLLALGTTTIGDGSGAGGLTINGSATTTGNLVIGGTTSWPTIRPGGVGNPSVGTFGFGVGGAGWLGEMPYLGDTGNDVALTYNIYSGNFGGTGRNYMFNGSASAFTQSIGNFYWVTWPVGTGGLSAPTPMIAAELSNTGTFSIGTTTPSTTASLYVMATSSQSGLNPVFNVASTTGLSLLTVLGSGNVGIGTTTPGSIFSVNNILNLTAATSTFYSTGGINLAGGCFSVNGACVGGSGGGGSGTVNSGTAGEFAFYNTAGTAVSGTSTIYISPTTQNIGIGTTSPIDELQVAGFSTPVAIASTSVGINVPDSIVVQGRYAYVLNQGGYGFSIYDISNPADPVVLTNEFTQGVGSSPEQLFVSGRYLYLADNGGGLIIYDISDPKLPLEVGSYTGVTAYNVYVQGRYAYIGGSNVFDVIDVSNPADPTLTASYVSGFNGYNLAVEGRYAFVGVGGSDIYTMDLTNPANPIRIGNDTSIPNCGEVGNLYVQGRYLYVTCSIAGSELGIIDISNPASLVQVGTAPIGGSNANGTGVVVAGRYAYVHNNYTSQIEVYDVSSSTDPFEVGSTTASVANPETMYIQGRYAFVGNGSGVGNLSVFELGGEYTQSLEAGTLQAGSLELDNNLQAVDGEFQGGLTVGSNLNVGGSLDVTASTFNATTTAGQNYSIFSINTASSSNPLLTALYNGDVGIGTSTLYSKLEVWGADTASSSAFSVVNSASTTVFAVYDNGNSTYSGLIYQSSDQRLKTDVVPLDASSSLSQILQLNPVSYIRIDQPETGQNLGFIAQQVQQVYPQLVSTTSASALTPGGTLTLNYSGLIAPIIAAIQELDQQLAQLANTVAGFARSFTSNSITANNELCVGTTCVTPAQFQAMVAAAGMPQSSGQGSSSSGGSTTSSSTQPINVSPIIEVNGNNPAVVQVGSTYQDLGAIITGPQQDMNLGITTYVNGSEMSPVVIDTSAVATDTIQYVATDQNGLTSTSSRTVIVEAAPSEDQSSTSTAPTDDASSTSPTDDSTSTPQ